MTRTTAQLGNTGVNRRSFLLCGAAVVLAAPARPEPAAAFTPEQFGARGDGKTNDTAAFVALSKAVNDAGGGTVSLAAGKTYIVGRQRAAGDMAFSPSPIIDVHDLKRPFRVLGNGARLKCAPGLRYGAFSRSTGARLDGKMPNYHLDQVACPYRAMILVKNCSGPVEIRDVRIDGSATQLRLGGDWGDVGRQVPADGIILMDNTGPELISNVQTFDHARDGIMISGAVHRSSRSKVSKLASLRNGRQGLSLIGGRGYEFADCDFNHTGRSVLRSDPAAGVDIEAENKTIRDLRFTRCKFIDNGGVGLLADSGDSADARFDNCVFVGTTAWSAWPSKPGFVFTGCTFVGAVVHPYASKDPFRATRFVGCTFTDDRHLSPTGKVYEGGTTGGPIVNMAQSQNVRFEKCRFSLVNRAVLPWSWSAVYVDCTMSQESRVTAMTKGKFLGKNVIRGPVDLYGSMIIGSLIVNGKAIPAGPRGVKAW